MFLKINNLLLIILLIVLPSTILGSHHPQHPRRPSYCYVVADPEVLECLDHCDDFEVSSYLACQRSCELDLYPEEGTDKAWERGRSVSPRRSQAVPHRRQITPQYAYGQCMQLCHDEQAEAEQGRPLRLEQCEQLCEERLRADQRKQDWDRERQLLLPSSSFIQNNNNNNYYYEEKDECQKRCDRVPRGQQRQLCRFRCRHKHHPTNYKLAAADENNYNPYYFHSRRFRQVFRTEEGHITVLDNFADTSPELLRSIQNYRLAILEANPNTIIMPHHGDAHYTLFVVKGTDITITLVKQEKKVSHKLEKGDVFIVPAGMTMYLSNAGSDQAIQIVKLIHRVNTPGSFQAHSKSVRESLDSRVTESGCESGKDQKSSLGTTCRKKKKSEEEEEKIEGGSSQRASKEAGPFNLLKQKPVYSNKLGQFFRASPYDNNQLEDLDISVAFAQLNQGTMFLPHYNSKTATLVFVTEGSGLFEMACPHLATTGPQRAYVEEGPEISGRYQQAASRLSAGDVFVILHCNRLTNSTNRTD